MTVPHLGLVCVDFVIFIRGRGQGVHTIVFECAAIIMTAGK